MAKGPIVMDRCFWQFDGANWIQLGDCPDGCSCVGKPALGGAYEYFQIEPGACDCSNLPSGGVAGGNFRSLSNGPQTANGIPVEVVEDFGLSFADKICFVAEWDPGAHQNVKVSPVFNREDLGELGVGNVEIVLNATTRVHVSQQDAECIEAIINNIRGRFLERSNPLNSDLVFFKLSR